MTSNDRQYHFITGLPRSGSTLLAAILRQNPRMSAGMTSPLGTLFETLISSMSAGNELAPLISNKAKKSVLRGLLDNYYTDLPAEKELVLDTNRAWVTHVDDFNNVVYQADAVDVQLGVRGLHSIRQKVAIGDRRTILSPDLLPPELPPDLFQRYEQDNFWRELKNSAANVKTSKR